MKNGMYSLKEFKKDMGVTECEVCGGKCSTKQEIRLGICEDHFEEALDSGIIESIH